MEFLGVASVLDAIRAVEGGSVDQDDFDVIGDEWDLEDRTVAELARVGLPPDILRRRIGEPSGE